MKYLKKFKFWLLLITLLYTVSGFIIVPWFLTNKVPNILKENIGINIEINKAKFNPFTFELSLTDVLLRDLDKHPAVGFKNLYLNYTPLRLLEGTIVLRHLEITSPKLYTRIYTDGKINLENIIPPSDVITQKVEKDEPTELPAIILEKLNITNGNFEFSDLRGRKPFSLEFGPFNIAAHDISTIEGDLHAHTLKTKINNTAELFWEGGMKLNPLSLYGELNIQNLELRHFYDYALPQIGASLREGSLSLNIPYQIDLSKNLQANINHANLTLSKIKVFNKANKNKMIDIPKIKLTDFNLKYPQQDIVINSFSIDDSSIFTLLDKNYELNLAKAFAMKTPDQEEVKENNNSKPWNFLLKNANINNTNLTFVDMTLNQPIKSELRKTSLALQNISSKKLTPIEYELSSILNKNSNIKASGNVIQEPLFVNSNITLENLHVIEFVEYIKPHVNFDIKNADINLLANLKANLSKDKDIQLQASSSINDLQINDQKNKKLLSWKSLDVKDINLKWPKQSVTVDGITLNSPYVYTVLDKNHELNLVKILNDTKQNKDMQPTKSATPSEDNNSKPWEFLVKKANIDKANVIFIDNSLQESVKSELSKTSLHVENISSKKASAINYKFASILNKNSKINLAGKVIQEPLFVSSDIALKDLHVKDFVAYLKPYVNFDIQKADIDVKANVKAKLEKKTDIQLSANTSIKNLHINGGNSKKLLAWKNLDINGIKYSHEPMSLDIKELNLKEPYIKAHIAKDGSTNFSNLIKETPNDESKNDSNQTLKKESPPMKIVIGPMKFVNGTSDFSDLSLPFPFATKIHDLNGDFSTLNFQTTTPSLLNLEGKIDKYGYTHITGKLSPFNIKENATLDVLFKNVDLSSLTPYSGKFVGYKIKSGKLSMDLKYDIKKSKLQGDNKLNIDTLVLGDTVESKDAVNLPLGLAIALLKDSNDQIDINMPVKGDMDNPEFSYGSVIWGAVGNMITGIVTAPFKFLGSMLGIDGDELKSIDFDKGTDEIISTEHEKLENLQKILGKRPGIKLVITGGYNEVYDVQALQEQKLNAIIQEELKKLKVDKKATKTDTYGIVLKKLYDEKFTAKVYDDKKKSMLVDKKGKKIKLDIVAFNTMLQNELSNEIKVSTEELILLANKRANNIKAVLIDEYKIDEKRVSITAPKLTEVKRERWILSELEIAI